MRLFSIDINGNKSESDFAIIAIADFIVCIFHSQPQKKITLDQKKDIATFAHNIA